MIFEVCIENGTRIDELVEKKAVRVELCDNLAAGGTTVSYGVAENVIRRCRAAGIRVMSMIRPRGGGFVYDENETAVMLRDIEVMRGLGADGVVFGCLTPDSGLDRALTARLVKAAAGMDITFHMAFDQMRENEQIPALAWLTERGVKRILSHGSADGSTPIAENLPRLHRYVKAAAGGIIILPGGGLDINNAPELCAALGLKEAHGTRIL
jgi:copper homeostasis protein